MDESEARLESRVKKQDSSHEARNRGSIHMAKKPLEKPPKKKLKISYTGKSPKIDILDMS